MCGEEKARSAFTHYHRNPNPKDDGTPELLFNQSGKDNSVETYKSNVAKSRKALEARNQRLLGDEEAENAANDNLQNIDAMENPVKPPVKNSHDRKIAIKYVYESIYGGIPEHLWEENGLITAIIKRLNIPEGSYGAMRTVLQNVAAANANGVPVDLKAGKRIRGKKPIITDECEEAAIIFNAIETNVSTMNIAVMVNVFRSKEKPPRPLVSFSAVERFVLHSDIINRTRRHTQKTGKDYKNSAWAKARTAQCAQFKEQFRLGTLPAGHPDLVNPVYPPVLLHALVTFYENHNKCILGHSSKWENRVARNPFDGKPTSIKFGSKLPAKKARTKPKYAQEAKGCFGVAIKRLPDGTEIGIRTAVFNYNGRKVVGVKRYDQEITRELRRVIR